MNVQDTLRAWAGPVIAHLEMAGLRFPVRHYQSVVDPGKLIRGSRLDEIGWRVLRQQSVRSIVDLRAEATQSDRSLARRNRFAYDNIPIQDNATPTAEQVDTFLNWATDPATLPCYVHCEAGQGRTGVMVAAYRIAYQDWTNEAALAEAKRFGCVMPGQLAFIAGFK